MADVPYALGSTLTIRPDGKVDYLKAVDFMSKWEMPTGIFWEKWFKEAYRTLKHGGHLLIYGIDRQLLLFKYYACLSGFVEKQSIYWYFISSFPKSADLSKMIDKNLKQDRQIIGQRNNGKGNNSGSGIYRMNKKEDNSMKKQVTITKPSHVLAEKYEGYKYSVAPLKQTCETIMVFQKPYQTGSCLHDTLKMEAGDETITCGALNIDTGRVPTNQPISVHNAPAGTFAGGEPDRGSDTTSYREHDGRYPSQTFVSSETAEILDEQSGITITKPDMNYKYNQVPLEKGNTFKGRDTYTPREDEGGCSRILHKCDYEQTDFDLFIYCPKVNSSERNNGLDNHEEKPKAGRDFRPNHTEKAELGQDGNPYGRWNEIRNNHPTVKPITLNKKILTLFKTPNPQRISYPFCGSGSEIIGGILAGFTDYTACDNNPDYIKIALDRVKHYQTEYETEQKNFKAQTKLEQWN